MFTLASQDLGDISWDVKLNDDCVFGPLSPAWPLAKPRADGSAQACCDLTIHAFGLTNPCYFFFFFFTSPPVTKRMDMGYRKWEKEDGYLGVYLDIEVYMKFAKMCL